MAASAVASGLVAGLEAKVKELEEALAGVTDQEASRPIDGDWSINHILSHLLGHDDKRLVERLQTFVDKDMPEVDVAVNDAVYTPARQKMTYAELHRAVLTQYQDMAAFLGSCTDEQLERRGHIPEFFKDTPLTATPTLSLWATGLTQFHLAGHIQQIREHRSRQPAW